jgi:hypothetical protein
VARLPYGSVPAWFPSAKFNFCNSVLNRGSERSGSKMASPPSHAIICESAASARSRWSSARASISWAVIRTLSPERATEPSTIASTSSAFAISGVAGRFRPWNCIAEPRDVTRSWLTVARAAVTSSVIPSASVCQRLSAPSAAM